MDSVYFLQLKLVVPKIFPDLNVVPVGWGSCPLRLAILLFLVYIIQMY